MEGKKARVFITSTQTIDGQADSIKEEYDAFCLNRDGKHYITYEKSDDGRVTKVLATISEDMLTIKQSGNIETVMKFKKHEIFINDYQTPFGLFKLVTSTRDYALTVSEEEINLRLTYFLEMNQGSPIQTDLSLKACFGN
ncbi:MAG: DUF1934 domain-containing protein [Bacteroidaceae bacterium]|nr:DUF1934 domain-containing protein [Bacteroidaceae bacterium]